MRRGPAPLLSGDRRAAARAKGRPAPTVLDALHLLDDRFHEMTQTLYDVREAVRGMIRELELKITDRGR